MTEPKVYYATLNEMRGIIQFTADRKFILLSDHDQAISELKQQLERAEKVIEFYADSENYFHDSDIENAKSKATGNICYDVLLCDFSREYKQGIDMSGRRARQYFTEKESVHKFLNTKDNVNTNKEKGE